MTKKVFLIVDDYESMRSVTSSQLSSMGVQNILVANNGEIALNILHNKHVDIVLSDWNMPVMTGLELLKAVRIDKKLSHLPFIMITAEVEREYIAEAIACGVSELIVKPFTKERLASRINKALCCPPAPLPIMRLGLIPCPLRLHPYRRLKIPQHQSAQPYSSWMICQTIY
ncbi:MAG: response regulator [Methylococcaceae bacterium]|nr:MAG: response regulator [Methylococcaceae bacterium]